MRTIPLLAAAIFVAILCLANLDGALPGNTNAPGEFTCGRAPCHNVPINIGNATMAIVFGDDEMVYTADSTFLVTVSITNPMTSRNGFEILALDENLKNAGTWEIIEPTQMKEISGFSDPTKKYVTHRAAGNQQMEWSLNWKAPAEDVGKVTFYASVLSANDNGQNTGDEVYNTNIVVDFGMVSSTKDHSFSAIKVYPVLASTGFWVEQTFGNERIQLDLYNLSGQLVRHDKLLDAGKQYLSVDGLSSGMYVLKLKSEDGAEVRKIIVQ